MDFWFIIPGPSEWLLDSWVAPLHLFSLLLAPNSSCHEIREDEGLISVVLGAASMINEFKHWLGELKAEIGGWFGILWFSSKGIHLD